MRGGLGGGRRRYDMVCSRCDIFGFFCFFLDFVAFLVLVIFGCCLLHSDFGDARDVAHEVARMMDNMGVVVVKHAPNVVDGGV